MKTPVLFMVAMLAIAAASAKLPPPSDEAKAKAAEAAAKAAHAGKVDAYELCKAMDHVAAVYAADAKQAGKSVSAPTPTPPCVDPGPFVAAAPAAVAPAASAAKQ